MRAVIRVSAVGLLLSLGLLVEPAAAAARNSLKRLPTNQGDFAPSTQTGNFGFRCAR